MMSLFDAGSTATATGDGPVGKVVLGDGRRFGWVGSIMERVELFVFTTYAVFVSGLNAPNEAPGSAPPLLLVNASGKIDWSIRLKNKIAPPDDGSAKIAVSVSGLMPIP